MFVNHLGYAFSVLLLVLELQVYHQVKFIVDGLVS